MANRKTIFVLLLCLICFSLNQTVRAEEPEIIDKVVVTGIGLDADKAKQNAIRNAVEQVIGTYVTSDTIVQNSTVLKDEVLTYSGGYVKDSKILSQEKNNDGLLSVKIEAYVVSTKLKRKLEQLNIATKKIEGGSLFSEAFSRVEEKKSAQELLIKITSKYPQAAYVFDVGKPEIQSTDTSTNRANIVIPVSIRWDESFLAELRGVLSKVAKEELKNAGLDGIFNKKRYNMRSNKAICFSPRIPLRSGNAEVCEILDESIVKLGRKREISFFDLPHHANGMSLLLTFKDKLGNTVDAVKYTFKDKDSDSPSKQGQPHYAGGKRVPSLRGSFFLPPNTLFRDPYNRHILIVTDGIFSIDAMVSIDVNILKDISSIEVQMNPLES